MAEHASDYVHGQMDIRQNEGSFRIFVGMTKWGSLAVAAGVLFFAMWFCTSAGFLGGLIAAVVVLAVGVAVLRDKPQPAGGH